MRYTNRLLLDYCYYYFWKEWKFGDIRWHSLAVHSGLSGGNHWKSQLPAVDSLVLFWYLMLILNADVLAAKFILDRLFCQYKLWDNG